MSTHPEVTEDVQGVILNALCRVRERLDVPDGCSLNEKGWEALQAAAFEGVREATAAAKDADGEDKDALLFAAAFLEVVEHAACLSEEYEDATDRIQQAAERAIAGMVRVFGGTEPAWRGE